MTPKFEFAKMRNKGGVSMKLEELKMAHVEECIDLYIDTFQKNLGMMYLSQKIRYELTTTIF